MRTVLGSEPCLFAWLLLLHGTGGEQSPEQRNRRPMPRRKWKKAVPQTPPGVTLLTEVIARYPEHDVELLVYVPDKPAVYPAILDIHGGGWQSRQVENDRPMMERLATRGFVTALISYRLSGEAKYPAALDDCKAAVRYLRANAERFKINPEHIGVMGGSAGGHLCGLLAMTGGLSDFEGDGPNRESSSRVQACIVMAATHGSRRRQPGEDFSRGAIVFFGGTRAELPELYRKGLADHASAASACRRQSSSKAKRTRSKSAAPRCRKGAAFAAHRNRVAHAERRPASVLDASALARSDGRYCVRVLSSNSASRSSSATR